MKWDQRRHALNWTTTLSALERGRLSNCARIDLLCKADHPFLHRSISWIEQNKKTQQSKVDGNVDYIKVVEQEKGKEGLGRSEGELSAACQ